MSLKSGRLDLHISDVHAPGPLRDRHAGGGDALADSDGLTLNFFLGPRRVQPYSPGSA
ncbi:hypothetical protein AURDEDRAFT_160820 [Auricularia subglabra TFB-10046 SS5]|nr:hypothetical protein AURDEDRAFT_160797 [Auricularia subglabra TFB-10046 SS5]EJD50281.1 hypothetical protein AURDEDRAFT_160816 [Auricularia subglabra TFB-10046 SS5]EJD50285.1 hypothetical protein AURDEDRAFT_160820 [Auricularia subglabra TFB-10046 SS5]